MVRAVLPALVLLLASCGGFDAHYDCEQTVACVASFEGRAVGDGEVDQCVAVAESQARVATDDQQTLADEAFATCEGQQGCAYTTCMCDATGRTGEPADSDCTKARSAP